MVVEEKTLILLDTAATGAALLGGWGGADRVAPTGISSFVLCRGLADLGELWPPSRQGLGELWRRCLLGRRRQRWAAMNRWQVSEEGAGGGLKMYATW
jgi:hypothetical protein